MTVRWAGRPFTDPLPTLLRATVGELADQCPSVARMPFGYRDAAGGTS